MGNAVLECGSGTSWLAASEETGRYVAVYHGMQPEPLRLTMPGGKVVVAAMGAGTLV